MSFLYHRLCSKLGENNDVKPFDQDVARLPVHLCHEVADLLVDPEPGAAEPQPLLVAKIRIGVQLERRQSRWMACGANS